MRREIDPQNPTQVCTFSPFLSRSSKDVTFRTIQSLLHHEGFNHALELH
jgi:hypothetical protein